MPTSDLDDMTIEVRAAVEAILAVPNQTDRLWGVLFDFAVGSRAEDELLEQLHEVDGCCRVYVLGFSSGVIKVGMSGDLRTRFAALGAQHGTIEHVAFTEHHTERTAYAFEQACHKALEEHRVPGTVEFVSGISFVDALCKLPEYDPPFYVPSPTYRGDLLDLAKGIMLRGNNALCHELKVRAASRCASALLSAYTERV